MAKNRVIKVIGTKKGKCEMCLAGPDKEVFILNSPAYPTTCCPEHFVVYAKGLNPKETPEEK